MKSFSAHLKETGEVGYVEKIMPFIAHVAGLPMVKQDEVVVFETGELGQIISLQDQTVEVLVFGKSNIRPGVRVARTGKLLEIAAGDKLLGQVIDPLGGYVGEFKSKKISSGSMRQIDIVPAGILARKRMSKQLLTGVAIVDLTVPLGRGQREMIIGDVNVGKSTLCYQTIVTQARQGTICIYAAIGKKKVAVKRAQEYFAEAAVSDKIIIVASGAQDPALAFLTPYTAMAIAEHFRDEGRDVLLVLDDMSTHAKAYREISLLARRFPGRESYPGDMFYIHARLLERAGNFTKGSITCLPVVGMPGNVFGYIQTNLISITDGHIYLDSNLFAKGVRPAVNPFLSVTRVGHQTQIPLAREASRQIINLLSSYEKVQGYVRFGAESTEEIKKTLSHGAQLTAVFAQSASTVLPETLELTLAALAWNGLLAADEITSTEKKVEDIIASYFTNGSMRKMVNNLTKTLTWQKFLDEVAGKEADFFPKVRAREIVTNEETAGTN